MGYKAHEVRVFGSARKSPIAPVYHPPTRRGTLERISNGPVDYIEVSPLPATTSVLAQCLASTNGQP